MFNLWAFLLQTLTASGIAVLLLLLKTLLRDKLPPKWQFFVWSVLGISLLFPAGYRGSYVLFHWQVPVEILKAWFGNFQFIHVYFPFPVLSGLPQTPEEWIFAGYISGVLFFLIKYIDSYVRLRLILRRGKVLQEEETMRIQELALVYKVKLDRIIAVEGLPGAFVCGVFRPALVIPAFEDDQNFVKNSEELLDEKILMHELFHLKHHDTLWSVIICIFRSIHWCNPLMVYCAECALNDMEARCDQYVLENLKGEARRDYGEILLSMTNEKYAKTPATTCINNGGKNIRRRIEAIARFRRYPAGMQLVSGCMVIILTASVLIGVQPERVYAQGNSVQINLAAARSTPCVTCAGALDTYAKAVLSQNGVYRAASAPESMQEALFREIQTKKQSGTNPTWYCGMEIPADTTFGYYIYNLKQIKKDCYEALLVFRLRYPPDGKAAEDQKMYLALQNVQVEKEDQRWVISDTADFQFVEAQPGDFITWGCEEIPAVVYAAEAENIGVEIKLQTISCIDNVVQNEDQSFFDGAESFDLEPKPAAKFWRVMRMQEIWCSYQEESQNGKQTNSEPKHAIGNKADKPVYRKGDIKTIGVSAAPFYDNGNTADKIPLLDESSSGISSGSTDGAFSASSEVKTGWEKGTNLGGGGDSDEAMHFGSEMPKFYGARLYINGKQVAVLTLELKKEGEK